MSVLPKMPALEWTTPRDGFYMDRSDNLLTNPGLAISPGRCQERKAVGSKPSQKLATYCHLLPFGAAKPLRLLRPAACPRLRNIPFWSHFFAGLRTYSRAES